MWGGNLVEKKVWKQRVNRNSVYMYDEVRIMLKFHADLGGWLVILSTLSGIIIIIVGQFPFPTTDGWMVANGFTARFVGVGFLGLAASFFGVFHFTNSAYEYFVQHYLAKIGLAIFIFSFLNLGLKMFPKK